MNGSRLGLFFGLALLALSPGCRGEGKRLFTESRIVMGTVVEITVADASEQRARAAIGEALAELQRVDDLMSAHQPGSLLSRLNRDGHASRVPVGEELYQLLRQAVGICRESGGAFDPTVHPVAQLWGIDRGGPVPDPAALAERTRLVGCRDLVLDERDRSAGFSRDGMGLDLGAIAKGWAVDRAMEKLAARGIRDAIVDAGGDLRVAGARPGRGVWRVGIRHPREEGTLLATLELRDTAVVTSGDYERFFVEGGVRYHHLLDPATGQPARGCQSVTVLAPTAAEADACATAAFVLGPERGLAFLRARPGVGGLIVDAGGALHWTDEALERSAKRR